GGLGPPSAGPPTPPPQQPTPDYGIIGKTILMGINDEELKDCQISANGSCTTNAVSPVLQILNQIIGVEKAVLNTIHSYTATQKIVDLPDKKDFRRGRAGAQNIIPTTTGAAIATTLAIKNLAGKFDGMATRVPVVLGSLVDLTFITKRNTNKNEINAILKQASAEKKWEGIFTTTDEPLVSADIIGNRHASIADLSLTKVVDGNLVKVLIWYDNEMGYANTLIKHLLKIVV
ncbi:MAG: type I glyceraldehyde-3-phosphate dehydrogenase, partial [Patescibacteria group bacterium]